MRVCILWTDQSHRRLFFSGKADRLSQLNAYFQRCYFQVYDWYFRMFSDPAGLPSSGNDNICRLFQRFFRFLL